MRWISAHVFDLRVPGARRLIGRGGRDAEAFLGVEAIISGAHAKSDNKCRLFRTWK